MSQRDDDMVVDFAIAPDKAALFYRTTPDDVLFETDVQVTRDIMDILCETQPPQLTSVPEGVWEQIDAVMQADDAGVAELPAEFVAGLAVSHTLKSRRAPITGALPVIPASGPLPAVVASGPRHHLHASIPHSTPPAAPVSSQPAEELEPDTVTAGGAPALAEPSSRGVAGRLAALTVAFSVVGVAVGLAVGLWGSSTVLSPITHQQNSVPTVESSLVPQSLPGSSETMPVGHGVDLVAPGTNTVAGRVDLASGDGQLQLRVTLKAVPAAGSYLEAWLLRPDSSARVSLGVLTPGRATIVRVPSSLYAAGLTVFDVSQEPIDNQPAFSGTSVARGVISPAPPVASAPEN